MNDDYINGLQVAYKIVYSLQQKTTGIEYKILEHAIVNIDREINKACAGDLKKKIILIS